MPVLSASSGVTSQVRILRSVKQGDPLSPLLFNLALDPIIYTLEEFGEGVAVGDGASLTSMAYADDLVLVSDNWHGMYRNLAILETLSQLTGLTPNPTKCHGFMLSKCGRRINLNDCSPWSLMGEHIHMVAMTETIKYLGVDISPWRGVVLQSQVPYLKTLIKKIDNPRLKPTQKVVILRYYAIPKLIYVCVNSDAKLNELAQLDKEVRQAVKRWLHLDHFVTVYSRSKDGGLNITKMALLVPASRIRGLLKLANTENETTAAVVQAAGIDRKIRKLIKALTGKEPPSNLNDFDPSTVYSRTLKRLEFKKWTRQIVQGKGAIHFENDSISNHWLMDLTKVGMTQSEFVLALQLRSNSMRTRSHVPGAPASCRLCGFEKETLAHIIGNCPAVKGQRMANYNNICEKLSRLAEKAGWEVWREKHIRAHGKDWVPDLIMAKGQEAIIIDVAINFEQNTLLLDRVAQVKTCKYKPIRAAVKEWLSVKHVNTLGFPMGARGKWHVPNEGTLMKLDLNSNQCKKTRKILFQDGPIRLYQNMQGLFPKVWP